MQEIWKDIKGYEGFFKVSNLGRIKSLERVCEHYNGYVYTTRIVKEKIRKQQVSPKGYLSVTLSDGKIRKKYQVHRIVAEAFIPNPKNKQTVNHKNGIKTDNRIENLEWATQKENVIHSWKNGLAKMTQSKIEACRKNARKNGLGSKKYQKPVEQYNLNMQLIASYSGLKEAQRHTNIHEGSISNCCKGKSKTAGGYIWKYAKEE